MGRAGNTSVEKHKNLSQTIVNRQLPRIFIAILICFNMLQACNDEGGIIPLTIKMVVKDQNGRSVRTPL